jgi:hypothetical protein
LEANANAEIGFFCFDPAAERISEAKAIQVVHAVAEGALSGEDEVGQFIQSLGSGD